MANSSVTLDKLIIRLNFSKLVVHIEKNSHLNWYIFLSVTPKLRWNKSKNAIQSNITYNKFDYKINIRRVFRANSGHSLWSC